MESYSYSIKCTVHINRVALHTQLIVELCAVELVVK